MWWLSISIFLGLISLYLTIEGLWYLSIIPTLGIVSVIWTWVTGAAWDPTPKKVIEKILDNLDIKEIDIVYDLGCGDGRFLIETAKRYRCRCIGIEIDPIRYLISKIRVKLHKLEDRIEIRFGNFFSSDLRGATVIFCFLTEETNRELEYKFYKELPYGTIVISYVWRFKGLKLFKVIDNEIFFYMI